MRVTTAGQTRDLIARMQDSQQKLAAAQRRVSTGLKLERLSDDPTSGAAVMQAGAGKRGLTQYTRNVERLRASLDAEDGVLQQLSELTGRARELGVAANSATSTAGARAASAEELKQLLAQAVSLGNTRIGDAYLFGGATNDGRPPFDPEGAAWVPEDAGVPRYPRGEQTVEAGAGGQRLTGAHDGAAVFLGRLPDGSPDPDTGILAALKQMQDAMLANDQSAVAAALATLDGADLGLQSTVGALGARQNHADTLAAGLTALDDVLTRQKSELSEVDAEQAVTEMLARQTAYQAAMLASSKVMGMSLTDYLR